MFKKRILLSILFYKQIYTSNSRKYFSIRIPNIMNCNKCKKCYYGYFYIAILIAMKYVVYSVAKNL